MKCTICGNETPEGIAICEACRSKQAETTQSDKIAATLARIEETQNKSLRMLKSISSSTAILAAVVIMQFVSIIIFLLVRLL